MDGSNESLTAPVLDLNHEASPTETQPVTDAPPTHDSQTASDFINTQLQLEADAREALPFSFDSCTKPLGALRQNIFSCITCNPPPSSPSDPYNPAGVCYGCSISCHGEHTLVELFARRDFVCDCGTTRLPTTSPCTLRINAETGLKGSVHSEEPAKENTYNQNYRNNFCGCGEIYDAQKQKGTMYQCLGLATERDGGCGEDWYHPECLMGLPRDWHTAKAEQKKSDQFPQDKPLSLESKDSQEAEDEEHPVPPGFPDEEQFEILICYKCAETAPWIKRYASSEGFLPPLQQNDTSYKISKLETGGTILTNPSEPVAQNTKIETELSILSKKRKAEDEGSDVDSVSSKKPRVETKPLMVSEDTTAAKLCCVAKLPPAPLGLISLFGISDDFRSHFCRCVDCYPSLSKYPQLLEEEELYEPPVSEDGNNGEGGGSVGTGSLLDMGEAALSNVDRVRAIEGVMVYNHLRDKVKNFLQPFAESGQAVGAEDIKAYFEKLRGDAEAIRAAGGVAASNGDSKGGDDSRREQGGY